MELKTNLKKIGSSYHFLIPSSLIKVYNLLNYVYTHDYSVHVENEGKRIILNRKKKLSDEEQTTLDKF